MSSIPPKPESSIDWDQSGKLWEQRINKAFNKFAGKEINRGDDHDPVLKEMQFEAMAHGSRLRLLWSDETSGLEEVDTSRVTAYIDQDADGKWRVGKKFTVG